MSISIREINDEYKVSKEMIELISNFFEEYEYEDPNGTAHKVRLMINEEYGIAKEVEKETIKLKNKMENDIRDADFGDGSDEFLRGYDDNFKYNCFGEIISIEYHIYDFPNEEECDNYEKKLPKSQFYTLKNGEIRLLFHIMTVNGVVSARGEDTIQHELHHFYQYVMKKGKPLFSSKYKELYDIATHAKGKEFEEERRKLFKEFELKPLSVLDAALYCSFENEMTAFLNGLDAHMRGGLATPSVEISNSIVYKCIQLIEGVLNNWENYKPLVERGYGVKPYICYNLFRHAWNDYCRGIARLITKYKRKQDKEYTPLLHDRNWFGHWKFTLNRIDDMAKKNNLSILAESLKERIKIEIPTI